MAIKLNDLSQQKTYNVSNTPQKPNWNINRGRHFRKKIQDSERRWTELMIVCCCFLFVGNEKPQNISISQCEPHSRVIIVGRFLECVILAADQRMDWIRGGTIAPGYKSPVKNEEPFRSGHYLYGRKICSHIYNRIMGTGIVPIGDHQKARERA